MTIYSLIKDYARQNRGHFRLKCFLEFLKENGYDYSRYAVANALGKMVADGILEREKRGAYKVFLPTKQVFVTDLTEDAAKLYAQLKPYFPFVDICVWKFSEVIHFTRHVPMVNFLIVEVEKDVVESVADRIFMLNDFVVLRNPTQEEMQKFSFLQNLVVVKTLVSRSPVIKTEKNVFPQLEKILVDILCDETFYMLHGIETLYIYQTAFDLYSVDEAALRRYASRRNKLKEVESLIEESK